MPRRDGRNGQANAVDEGGAGNESDADGRDGTAETGLAGRSAADGNDPADTSDAGSSDAGSDDTDGPTKVGLVNEDGNGTQAEPGGLGDTSDSGGAAGAVGAVGAVGAAEAQAAGTGDDPFDFGDSGPGDAEGSDMQIVDGGGFGDRLSGSGGNDMLNGKSGDDIVSGGGWARRDPWRGRRRHASRRGRR